MAQKSTRPGGMHAPRYETAYASAAFNYYAAMGPSRSLRKMAKGWKEGQGSENAKFQWLSTLSAAFGWQERVKRYDAEEAEKLAAKRLARYEKMNDDHATLAEKLRAASGEAALALIEKKALGAQNIVQMYKHASDLERTAVEAALGDGKRNEPARIQITIVTEQNDQWAALPPGRVVDAG